MFKMLDRDYCHWRHNSDQFSVSKQITEYITIVFFSMKTKGLITLLATLCSRRKTAWFYSYTGHGYKSSGLVFC